MIAARPPAPWTTAQVRLVAACDVIAALVVLWAAAVADGQDGLADQIAWINVGVLGLLLAVVANGSLFLAARRAVGHRRLELLPDVIAALAAPSGAGAGEGASAWWWLPGTTRAHVAGCQMVAGKPARTVTAAQIRTKKLQRCEVCG